MSQPYIVLETLERDPDQPEIKVKQTRKITVIDGQPYYQSTGTNSKGPGKWFPFIMLKGDIADQAHNLKKLTGLYNTNLLELALTDARFGALYIIKFEVLTISSVHQKLHTKLYKGRIPTKATLIIANRLGLNDGKSFDEETLETHLNEEEIKQAKEPIQLAPEPEFQANSSYLINNWLIKQGARAAYLSLRGNDWDNEERIMREKTAAQCLLSGARDNPTPKHVVEAPKYVAESPPAHSNTCEVIQNTLIACMLIIPPLTPFALGCIFGKISTKVGCKAQTSFFPPFKQPEKQDPLVERRNERRLVN